MQKRNGLLSGFRGKNSNIRGITAITEQFRRIDLNTTTLNRTARQKVNISFTTSSRGTNSESCFKEQETEKSWSKNRLPLLNSVRLLNLISERSHLSGTRLKCFEKSAL